MPVAAPADKRFRRAHVSPAKRVTLRDGWPRLARIVIGCALVMAAVYFAAGRALSAESLTINRITVTGNVRVAHGEVMALLEGLQGANMLTADLDYWRRKLLGSPWVSDVAIRRVFPGTLTVAIAERQPLGIGRIGDQLYLLDRRGIVIDEYGPNYADLDLPIIDGLSGHAGPDRLMVDELRAALAGRFLGELSARPDLTRRVSQIDVSDAHDAVVLLENDTVLVRVGEDHFVERLQAYLDLARALRQRIPDIDYVDLRFGDRVYVRPHESASKTPKGRKGSGR
jgi:cell division protein FtsQ